ncbi:MAG: polyphosphate polymerase domain-containing protein [Candidatus Izemoplasmatales bacterium]
MDLKRTELKFIITLDEAAKLSQELAMILERDPYASSNGHYRISSLYFDDLYDSHVLEKADGIEYHQKFRIRRYANEAVRLEFKTKNGLLTAKESMWLTNEVESALLEENTQVLMQHATEPLIEQILVRMKLDRLRPMLWIDYDREAFLHPVGDTRITFDKNVTVRKFGQSEVFSRKVLEPGQMILEVKYTGKLPTLIATTLRLHRFQPLSVSKYYLGWLYSQV